MGGQELSESATTSRRNGNGAVSGGRRTKTTLLPFAKNEAKARAEPRDETREFSSILQYM